MGGLGDKYVILIHDVSSAQRLIDFAKLVYGLGFKILVASKVYGAAASSGIPEVMRLAIRKGKIFTVLSEAKEAVELFEPEKVVVVSREYGEPIEPNDLASKLGDYRKTLIIFGGIDPAPGKDVVGLGEAVYPIATESRLGPVAEAALLLYPLSRGSTQETS